MVEKKTSITWLTFTVVAICVIWWVRSDGIYARSHSCSLSVASDVLEVLPPGMTAEIGVTPSGSSIAGDLDLCQTWSAASSDSWMAVTSPVYGPIFGSALGSGTKGFSLGAAGAEDLQLEIASNCAAPWSFNKKQWFLRCGTSRVGQVSVHQSIWPPNGEQQRVDVEIRQQGLPEPPLLELEKCVRTLSGLTADVHWQAASDLQPGWGLRYQLFGTTEKGSVLYDARPGPDEREWSVLTTGEVVFLELAICSERTPEVYCSAAVNVLDLRDC